MPLKPMAEDDDDDDNPQEKVLVTILGPVTGAFPLNEGWHMKGQTPRKPQVDPAFGDDLRRLSDLTIHEITAHLTELKVGDARPSCETNWFISKHTSMEQRPTLRFSTKKAPFRCVREHWVAQQGCNVEAGTCPQVCQNKRSGSHSPTRPHIHTLHTL